MHTAAYTVSRKSRIGGVCSLAYWAFSILWWSYPGTHTHYTRLTAICPGLPGCASTRKVKPIWILLKQQTVSGSGISWPICKSAPRSRQITMPAPHHSVFYGPDALPATQRAGSKHWRHLIKETRANCGLTYVHQKLLYTGWRVERIWKCRWICAVVGSSSRAVYTDKRNAEHQCVWRLPWSLPSAEPCVCHDGNTAQKHCLCRHRQTGRTFCGCKMPMTFSHRLV